MRAAARAAIDAGLPYAVTGSFDTAGRTMMGLAPADLAGVFADLAVQPVAIGANCGVGASDLLLTVQQIQHPTARIIAKSNCGIPQFQGAEVVYSGDPLLMAQYATLAVDSGARIIGGCCGTSPEHLAEMKRALDAHVPGEQPQRRSTSSPRSARSPTRRRKNSPPVASAGAAAPADAAVSVVARRPRAAALHLAAPLLAAIRRSFDALVGCVGRRGRSTWSAPCSLSTSRRSASARLRSWLRSSSATIRTSAPSRSITRWR